LIRVLDLAIALLRRENYCLGAASLCRWIMRKEDLDEQRSIQRARRSVMVNNIYCPLQLALLLFRIVAHGIVFGYC
jgi:hypothetical protein